MEGNIVQQLDSRFLSFWLANWGGPWTLSLLLLNDSGEKYIGKFLQW